MPSSTTVRRLTAPVRPDAAAHGACRHGLFAGVGAVLALALLAGLVAALMGAGRTASADPTRQLADRIRAQEPPATPSRSRRSPHRRETSPHA
ncbi:hypothetical protein [Streptomyces sp. NPDC059262]|uniref:hypothetical protein n=1 Tax=Streptomyces sp. NPDC059262 TaxID=3346797 RepID=UPI0036AEEB62